MIDVNCDGNSSFMYDVGKHTAGGSLFSLFTIDRLHFHFDFNSIFAHIRFVTFTF